MRSLNFVKQSLRRRLHVLTGELVESTTPGAAPRAVFQRGEARNEKFEVSGIPPSAFGLRHSGFHLQAPGSRPQLQQGGRSHLWGAMKLLERIWQSVYQYL